MTQIISKNTQLFASQTNPTWIACEVNIIWMFTKYFLDRMREELGNLSRSSVMWFPTGSLGNSPFVPTSRGPGIKMKSENSTRRGNEAISSASDVNRRNSLWIPVESIEKLDETKSPQKRKEGGHASSLYLVNSALSRSKTSDRSRNTSERMRRDGVSIDDSFSTDDSISLVCSFSISCSFSCS